MPHMKIKRNYPFPWEIQVLKKCKYFLDHPVFGTMTVFAVLTPSGNTFQRVDAATAKDDHRERPSAKPVLKIAAKT